MKHFTWLIIVGVLGLASSFVSEIASADDNTAVFDLEK